MTASKITTTKATRAAATLTDGRPFRAETTHGGKVEISTSTIELADLDTVIACLQALKAGVDGQTKTETKSDQPQVGTKVRAVKLVGGYIGGLGEEGVVYEVRTWRDSDTNKDHGSVSVEFSDGRVTVRALQLFKETFEVIK